MIPSGVCAVWARATTGTPGIATEVYAGRVIGERRTP